MTPVSFTVWSSFEAASISWNWWGWTRVSTLVTFWYTGTTRWSPGSSVTVWTWPKLVTTPTLPAGTSTNGPARPMIVMSPPRTTPRMPHTMWTGRGVSVTTFGP